MNAEEIGRKFFESSIKVMERNRTLLFTINLIAALLLVVVYLERMSFDTEQRERHLIAYKDACDDLKSRTASLELAEDERNVLNKCYDFNQISGILVSKSISPDLLKQLSSDLFRLNRMQNEMENVRLESAIVAPLGFGLPVPRNDLVIICGVILLMLYTWLAFSFKQHARIILELAESFKEDGDTKEVNEKKLKTFNRLIEANFMFKTSDRSLASVFVKLLYFAAPIAMTIAAVNNFYIPRNGDWKHQLDEILKVPNALEIGIVVILWFIGVNINQSDKKSNAVSAPKTAENQKTVDEVA